MNYSVIFLLLHNTLPPSGCEEETSLRAKKKKVYKMTLLVTFDHIFVIVQYQKK